jgi:hypothetical protein
MSAEPAPDRRTRRAARFVRSFGARHSRAGDATVRCALEHLGRDRVRLVLLGADGRYGDLVVDGRERAERVVRLAGAVPDDVADRSFGAAVRTGPYEWLRMAGMQLGRH